MWSREQFYQSISVGPPENIVWYHIVNVLVLSCSLKLSSSSSMQFLVYFAELKQWLCSLPNHNKKKQWLCSFCFVFFFSKYYYKVEQISNRSLNSGWNTDIVHVRPLLLSFKLWQTPINFLQYLHGKFYIKYSWNKTNRAAIKASWNCERKQWKFFSTIPIRFMEIRSMLLAFFFLLFKFYFGNLNLAPLDTTKKGISCTLCIIM